MATQAPAQPDSTLSSARVPSRGSRLGSQSVPEAASGATRSGASSPTETAQVRDGTNLNETGSGHAGLMSTAVGNAFGAGRKAVSSDDDILLRLSAPQARLPVALDVMVPVRGFRVRHLLALTLDEVIETDWGHGEDLPLTSGEVQLAWSEFEVVDSRLAVRVTRLA
jgi:Type III flagellar switch regulator (C-ring) FliN C-term